MDIMHIDLHQHLWTEPLVDALRARVALPLARRAGGDTVLMLPGESPGRLETGPGTIERRLAAASVDGVDRIVIALSSPLGIEGLPRREADPLLDAYEQGIADLPPLFEAWGAIALHGARPRDVDRILDRGFAGLSVPAGALATPTGLGLLLPLLRRLESRGAPLFVHPGPSPWRRPRGIESGTPFWWPAMTQYVADMQAAWLAFALAGRPELPELPVVFAMLAGCAPLHGERLAARGGPSARVDPLTFFETSSYGPVAIDAMIRAVGVEQLVYGSDRPVAQPSPPADDAVDHALRVTNPARLFSLAPVAEAVAA
jgi:hypothetical protein